MIFDAVTSFPGIMALLIFFAAYILVATEEYTQLRKSKPVLLASGLIWILVAIIAKQTNQGAAAELAAKHNILEYGQLFLFLLVTMTYVNVLQERKVFEALRSWLINRGFSLKELFWITGLLAFFISPFIDNLTTALIMGAIVISVGKTHPKFVTLSCINIVVAANAGGVYSPFGDITSLMVWQTGALHFQDFFSLFFPALISYLVPAFAMSFFVNNAKSKIFQVEVKAEYGGNVVIMLFILTIITAVAFRTWLHLPPVLGMMMGLSYLKIYSYFLKITDHHMTVDEGYLTKTIPFDIIKKVERAEWDTLLFFYGIMLCVGGLATIGYLHYLSTYLYGDLSLGLSAAQQATPANVILGLISGVVDNIPVMYAVLNMAPDMSTGQWLLITLTTGIGGSILAIGSAAGVALLGQSQGKYTFFSHLKWTPAITLGYFAGVAAHLWINWQLF